MCRNTWIGDHHNPSSSLSILALSYCDTNSSGNPNQNLCLKLQLISWDIIYIIQPYSIVIFFRYNVCSWLGHARWLKIVIARSGPSWSNILFHLVFCIEYNLINVILSSWHILSFFVRHLNWKDSALLDVLPPSIQTSCHCLMIKMFYSVFPYDWDC